MPPNAIDHVAVDHVVPLGEMGRLNALILGDDRSQAGPPHTAPPAAVGDERSARRNRVAKIVDHQREILEGSGGVDQERLRIRQPEVSAVRRHEPVHRK